MAENQDSLKISDYLPSPALCGFPIFSSTLLTLYSGWLLEVCFFGSVAFWLRILVA